MEVSKEFILKAHKEACSDWKALIEKEFPALFIKRLEGDRWLKDDNHPLWLMFYDIEKKRRYGFSDLGIWVESEFMNSFKDLKNRYATDEEVQAPLINEVKRLGFKNGTRYFSLSYLPEIETLTDFDKLKLHNFNQLTDGGGGTIFYNGKFAKIVEPSKKELLQQQLDELQKQINEIREINEKIRT